MARHTRNSSKTTDPPQKQMEIKMHKKIIVCEYCGRIMIDPDLAGVTSEHTNG